MSAPADWKSVPFWSLFQRKKTVGFPAEELLSVYRDYGVIRKLDRDDNWNRAGKDLAAYQLVEPGDLVLNKMKTWQGSLGVSRHRGIVSPAYFVYKPQTEDDQRFLHHTLRSSHHVSYYASISKGIRPNQWDLQPEMLDLMHVFLPDIDTQRAIADKLDRTEQIIAGLDELTRELKTRTNVSFAELGRKLVAPGEKVQLGLLLKKQTREASSDDGVVTAFRDGQVALRSRRRESGFTMSANEAGYQGVEAGDFVFHGLDGFAGAVGVSEDRGKVSPVCHVCSATNLTSERFMAWAIRALSLNGYIEAHSFSVRQRSVDFRSWETFARLPLKYFPLEEQQYFVDHLDNVNGKINQMLAKIAELKALLLERRSAFISEVVTVKKEEV
ncbi:restriction endonuclease subunit S [Arthrobacter sp. S41]|uniref:restriction endonuclease subunit S n=1 Tax=Arthrobacter sp. S41 TaxID=2509721 RepID=UPI0010365BB4|nr:restriction endonuclease subunit S [Arthrobacter sp. S41]TAP26905.1 restriction endonuclease subunit S [Arthrobacter sp. S41]